MMELEGAHFWQAYSVIDIWRIQDTKAGTEKYFFWYQDRIHERDSEKEILNLAKLLLSSRGK